MTPTIFSDLINTYICRALRCVLIIYLSVFSINFSMADNGKDVFRIGGTLNGLYATSKKDTEIAFQLLFNEILEQIGATVTIKVYDDIEQVRRDILKNKLDAISCSSLEFLKVKDLLSHDRLFSFQMNGSFKWKFALFVNHSSKIDKINLLNNRKLAFTPVNDIALLFLDVALLKEGLTTNDHFFVKRTQYKDGHSALLAVFFEQADAALVSLSDFELANELNPQIGKTLRPIIVSDELVLGLSATVKGTSKQWVEQMQNVAFGLHETARGRNLLKIFRAEKVVDFKPDNLEMTFELVREREKLLKEKPK